MRRRLAAVLVPGLLLGSTLSCLPRVVPAARFHDAPPIAAGALGAHLADGGLVVLTDWSTVGEPPMALEGDGTRYDRHRRALETGPLRVDLDSVVLLETTVLDTLGMGAGESLGAAGLVAFTVATGLFTAVCLADPKACFGSCPTFYDDPAADRPVAEAFSGSIARALEARDIDYLPTVRPRDGRVRLTMRNEALETHAVRSVRLLALEPGPAGVGAADDGFHQLERIVEPIRCDAPEGDCLEAVRRLDGLERRSWTNPRDLADREVVELEFPAVDGPVALLLSARHTFVSTFVFYQMLAYLGADAGSVLAGVERGEGRYLRAFERAAALLGDLDVLVARGDGGRWAHAGTFAEPGPLATDTRLIHLPPGDGPVRVRLHMTRGYWRVEGARLARLGPRVEPHALEPAVVEREGQPDDAAHRALLDPDRHLVTGPGDAYDLVFHVPPDRHDARFFLDATGYYYEWMRGEWLDERDPLRVALFRYWPRALLRRLAPEFKAREAHMEEMFWASRFGREG
jgi:hypothetical protein